MDDNKLSKARKDVIKEPTESYELPERYEVIHGIRYDLQPSASFVHQVIVTSLYDSLNKTCHLEGVVVVAPIDVHLDEQNTVQPDVIFIRNENLHIIQRQRIEGSPDLLVEILSPSTGKHDRSRKKELYEMFGVQEYWIVDPIHYTLEQYSLDNSKYILLGVYGHGDTFGSDMLSCIRVDVDKLFATARRFEQY